MSYNWKKHYAIKLLYEKEFSSIPKQSGIYVWKRTENGITYFYVGQAENLYNRRFDYYKIQKGLAYPTRHFEASLKKHKDWKFYICELCEKDKLDQKERENINFYLSQPNHITRNELLANQDIVRSNYRRIKQIENKHDRAIKKCLDNLIIKLDGNGLKIGLKTTKNGSPTALSLKYFRKLLEILQIGGKNEEV